MRQMTAEERAKELEALADRIGARLIQNGFIVHRCDAESTNSIYLNIDYGVCNSIRISDHRGKQHLRYKFNIGFGIREPFTINDRGVDRFYWPPSQYGKLIEAVLRRRNMMLRRYGNDGYDNLVRRCAAESAHKYGFWTKARRVEDAAQV